MVTASTSTATSAVTSLSATASTSASGLRWRGLEGRVALDEVLSRFPEWEVDYDKAERAHASTVRGWETSAGDGTATCIAAPEESQERSNP